jgi:hypothetical protein
MMKTYVFYNDSDHSPMPRYSAAVSLLGWKKDKALKFMKHQTHRGIYDGLDYSHIPRDHTTLKHMLRFIRPKMTYRIKDMRPIVHDHLVSAMNADIKVIRDRKKAETAKALKPSKQTASAQAKNFDYSWFTNILAKSD